MPVPNWDDVDEALATAEAPCSASEAHGLLCGLLALAAARPRDTWRERALGSDAAAPVLDALYEETARQVDDADFGLELLLPDDERAPLADRTDALAQWCTGFATGAGLSGCAEAALSDDVREFLADVTRIAQAEAAAEEDDEAAYAEVVEYVRMGTLLARTECAREEAAD